METNKHYNVNIYYSEEEVLAAFTNYYDEVKQHSKVHVFTKDSTPLSHYTEDSNVELHHSGGFFDKIRSWLNGDEQFDDQFAHLNITPEDRQKYRNIIENGGTIIVSSADAIHHPTFQPDVVAYRDKFAEDFNDPVTSAAFGGTTSITNREKFANNAITDPEDPMFQALNSESEEFANSGSPNHKSYPYTPDTINEEESFKAIPKDYASETSEQFDLNDDHLLSENTNPEKKSFPYKPNEAIENEGSVLSHPAAENNELDEYSNTSYSNVNERGNSSTNDSQVNSLIEPMPENIAFNPVQDASFNNQELNKHNVANNHTLNRENQERLSSKPDEDIPMNDGHPNTSSPGDKLTDSHNLNNNPLKQEIAPEDTTNTFETISSRNINNTENDENEMNDFSNRLAPNDTLHRSVGLEDEETFQEFSENDENYSHLRDETIGKATDYRRHDLP